MMQSKRRLVDITDAPERDQLDIAFMDLPLDAPYVIWNNRRLWADADELRRWRASQHTSGVTDGT